MKRFLEILAIGLLSAAAPALAQHSDIEFGVEAGALAVEASSEGFFVFEGEFGEAPNPPNQIGEPGFESEGGLMPGDRVGFNVVQSLLYWDGAAFAPAPVGHSVNISLFPLGSVDVGPAGPGFVFGEADGAGEFHEDMLFTLNGPGAPDALTPGAYGLWLTLSSPSYADSNEFIILLNYGLGAEEFEAGVEAASYLVPEPASGLLLAIGLLACRGRRLMA